MGMASAQQPVAGDALVRLLAQWEGVERVLMGQRDVLLATESVCNVRELLEQRMAEQGEDGEALLLVVCRVDALCNVLAILLQWGCCHFSPLGYLPPAVTGVAQTP